MSNDATTWAWVQVVSTPVQKLVLMHLADSASKETGYRSWYSLANIAKRCNCSKSTASSNLKKLEDQGYIKLVRKGTRGGGTNCYRVNVGRIDVQDGPAEPIPGDGLSPVPRDELAIPGAEPSIPGAGPRTVKNRKLNKRNTSDSPTNTDTPRKGMTREQQEVVITMYNEMLPELTPVMVSRWHGSKHAKCLSARWEESSDFRTKGFWRLFFETVRTNPWWMGEVMPDGKVWKQCKLSWLVKRENFDKVLELGGFEDVA